MTKHLKLQESKRFNLFIRRQTLHQHHWEITGGRKPVWKRSRYDVAAFLSFLKLTKDLKNLSSSKNNFLNPTSGTACWWGPIQTRTIIRSQKGQPTTCMLATLERPQRKAKAKSRAPRWSKKKELNPTKTGCSQQFFLTSNHDFFYG